jgi:serine/threonine-protein kinase
VKLARSLKGDLDTIAMKALKKSPGERYPTANAFAEDTGRFLRGEIVLSQPDTLVYRLSKLARRHRAAVITSLLVGSGLIATSAFALLQMLDARAQRDLAVSEAKRAEGVRDLTEFLVADSLKQVPQDAIRNRLARARELVVRRAHDNPVVAAQLLLVLASLHRARR